MAFYKCLKSFLGFKEGDKILCSNFSHSFVVKLATSSEKTIYRKDLPYHPDRFGLIKKFDLYNLLRHGLIEELSICELEKIAPHLTYRIYRKDYLCNDMRLIGRYFVK